jgi:hypothetical protein
MESRISLGRSLADAVAALAVGVGVFPVFIWALHPYGKAVEALASSTVAERAMGLTLAVAASGWTFYRVWKNRHVPRIAWHE